MFLYLFRYLQIRYRNNTDFNFRGTILVSVVFVCAIIAADSVFFFFQCFVFISEIC